MTAKTSKRAASARLYDIPETCELLRMSKTKVYELIGDGELEAVDVARKGSRRPHLRIPDTAIQAYIANLPRVIP